MIRMIKLFVAILAIGILATGCVSFASSYKPGDKQNPEKAYLFGKFISDERLGIRLTNFNNNESYNIQFDKAKNAQVKVYEVSPGQIAITHFFNYHLGNEKGREVAYNPYNPKLSAQFTVEKGKLYYLGDFVGEKEYSSINLRYYAKLEKSTEELKGIYKELGSLTPVDALDAENMKTLYDLKAENDTMVAVYKNAIKGSESKERKINRVTFIAVQGLKIASENNEGKENISVKVTADTQETYIYHVDLKTYQDFQNKKITAEEFSKKVKTKVQ